MSAQKEDSALHKAIIGAWDCALADSRVTYLSGPITTGLRYAQQVWSGASADAARERARQENIDDLLATAKRLRKQRGEIIVEPASLDLPGWSQAEYHRLWEKLIERHARLVIFMPGWEYSVGCALEFAHASAHDIRTEALLGTSISINDGIALLLAARKDLRSNDVDGTLAGLVERLDEIIGRLKQLLRPVKIASQNLRKDESLDLLAERGMNVAQFVSFAPKNGKPRQVYARICGRRANESFMNLRSALEALLKTSVDKRINIRSYEPNDTQSREFLYGLTNVEDAATAVERLSAEGLHTIVNETIDVADGGVSGVLMGNILEFAPDDTPRCVEKPGTASLPRGLGRELLGTVYGFAVELPVPFASRLEFSLHPRPRGWRATNIITWEFAPQDWIDTQPQIIWPNKFSRLIGDKTFGLLVAHHLGLPVPHTTVVNRRVAPFSFGRSTGWGENWIRTAPPEQIPGLFATRRGWSDPFTLLRTEDPNGTDIASVLAQAGIYPAYSGALIVGADGETIIEGRAGIGEPLMRGETVPEPLPAGILQDVRDLYARAEAALGPVRFEWVHNGELAWIVQLHRGATESTPARVTSGEAKDWVQFDVEAGLEALRSLLAQLPRNTGVALKGGVGLTSHIADVIRKARVPARITH
jgi:hypothetical protein